MDDSKPSSRIRLTELPNFGYQEESADYDSRLVLPPVKKAAKEQRFVMSKETI